jgi:hypothetical protein
MSYLKDIFCDMPGLMEDAMNLRNPDLEAGQKVSSYQELARNILDHLNQLYTWRSRWEREHPNSRDEIPVRQHLDEQTPFPTMFYFSSIARADEFVLYNTCLIFLLRLGAQVIDPTLGASTPALHLPPITSRGPLYLPSEAKNVQAIATEICKCEGYYLSDYCNRAATPFFFLLESCICFLSADKQTGKMGGYNDGKNCKPEWIWCRQEFECRRMVRC